MHRKAMIQCLYSIKNLILPKQLESTHILNCIRFTNFWHWIDNSFFFSLTLNSQFIFFPPCVVIPQNQRIQVKKYWIVWKCTMQGWTCFCFFFFHHSCLCMKYIALRIWIEELKTDKYVLSMHYSYIAIKGVTETPLARKC